MKLAISLFIWDLKFITLEWDFFFFNLLRAQFRLGQLFSYIGVMKILSFSYEKRIIILWVAEF